MRLAVLSDIHGNLPALRAVMAEIATLAVDRIVNLGDCASGPLWPAETVALLREFGWPTVRGNHDRLVGRSADGRLGRSDRFAWRALDADARSWLAALPSTLEIEGAVCMHGLMDEDEAYLLDEISNGRISPSNPLAVSARIPSMDAPLVLCGHSHAQTVCVLDRGVTLVNPGSVGWQAYRSASLTQVYESGSPHARYAIVELGDGPPAVDLRAVAYDWGGAARRAERNGRPDWAHALRTGFALTVHAANRANDRASSA